MAQVKFRDDGNILLIEDSDNASLFDTDFEEFIWYVNMGLLDKARIKYYGRPEIEYFIALFAR